MMAWLRWQKGRQGTGYEKMLIATSRWPTPFDLYLLRFKKGQSIAPHTDVAAKGEHHRVNVVIKQASLGGEFICDEPIFETKRIKYFRPDISEHAVSEIIEGSRYVISFGWIRNPAA